MNKYINAGIAVLAILALVGGAAVVSAQTGLSVEINSPAAGASFPVNSTVNFEATATGGNSGNYAYVWNFGDGSSFGAGKTYSKSYTQVGPKTISVTVTDADGNQTVASRQINITAAQQPAPTVSLKANNETGSTSVNTGEEVTLSWSTTNATSCTASGEWSGNKSLGASENVGPFTTAGNRSYTLTCTGPGGTSSASVTVNVQSTGGNNVSVDLKVNGSNGPVTIATSTQFTLSWSSQNATSCTASGEWSGSKATSGSENATSVSNAGTSRTYTITCTGAAGTASDSVTVTTRTDDGSANPLTISNVRVTDVTRTSATIRWTTNKPATSRVVYDTASHSSLGSAPNYGYANTTGTTDTDPMVTEHAVTVTGLSSNTTYYFRVISEA